MMPVYCDTIRMDGLLPLVQRSAGADVFAATWSETRKATGPTLSPDKLTVSAGGTTDSNRTGQATVAITSGQKICFGVRATRLNTNPSTGIGIGSLSQSIVDGHYLGFDGAGMGFYSDGRIIKATVTQNFTGFVQGDEIVVAVDRGAGTAEWFVNGTSRTKQTHGISGDLYPAWNLKHDGTTASQVTLLRPDEFDIPAGLVGFGKYGVT